MSFYEGIIDQRFRAQQLKMNNLAIQDEQMKMDLTRRNMAATQAASQAWGQFDPSDVEGSLMRVAGAMGKAGAIDGADKVLGVAETALLRRQQQFNYQSEIAHRTAQEENAARLAGIRQDDEQRKEKADASRFQLQMATQERMAREASVRDRIAEQRVNIMMGHLGLAEKEAGKRDARADNHEKLWEEHERESVNKQHQAQAGATAKLKMQIERLNRPTTTQIKSTMAVLDEDERTKNAPDQVKQSLANLIASRAGQSIAKRLTPDDPNWTPDDHDAEVRDQLEKAISSGEIKVAKTGGFSIPFIGTVGQKDSVQLAPKKAAAPASSAPAAAPAAKASAPAGSATKGLGTQRVSGTIGKAGAKPAAKTAEGPARIKSDADYDKLPSGAEFIGPDGVTRRKP